MIIETSGTASTIASAVEAEKKTSSLTIRVSAADLAEIDKHAKLCNKSRGEYMLSLFHEYGCDANPQQESEFDFTIKNKLPSTKDFNHIKATKVLLNVKPILLKPIIKPEPISDSIKCYFTTDFGSELNPEIHLFYQTLSVYQVNSDTLAYWVYEKIEVRDKKNGDVIFLCKRGKTLSTYNEVEKYFGKYSSLDTLSSVESALIKEPANLSCDDLSKFFF